MPWQETCAMTERMRFVLAMEAGETSMAECCRRFGISRRIGYKWLARYRADGVSGLADRPRTARHHPHALSEAQRAAAVSLRERYPDWGPKKLAGCWPELYPDLPAPAPSTIGDVLQAAGLVVPRRRRRRVPPRTQPLAHATGPNLVWCTDFKGDFDLGDGTHCYPLTISDAYARPLLCCQGLRSTAASGVRPLYEATFREYGLPEFMRSDNGSPFASTGVGGLTRLSVWWVRLGICPERIDPGQPQQNGRLERLHGTLKRATCAPPAATLAEQQARFDAFRTCYNDERPHEALQQRPPSSVYTPSPRPYPERLPELVYPDGVAVRLVHHNGAIRWRGVETYVGEVLAGETVGLTETADGVWEVTFGPVFLGTIQAGSPRLERPR